MSFDTLATALEIHGAQVLKAKLAPPSAPPALTRPADFSLSIHESTLNNMAENVLTGMRLTDDMIDRTSLELTGKQRKRGPDEVTAVFPPDNARVVNGVEPMTVSFRDDRVTITLIGQTFIVNGQEQPDNWNVRATYKFEQTAEGFKAIRTGEGDRGLQIYKFGTKPNPKRVFLPGRLSVLSTSSTRFSHRKSSSIPSTSSAKPGNPPRQFVPQEIISQDGWLVIGYCRAKTICPTMAANN